MSKWNLIKEIKIGDVTPCTFFQIEHIKEADDIIEAAFTKWNGNYAREIKITFSSYHRIFKKIVYCPDKDTIEIHCQIDENLTQSTYLEEVSINCLVACLKVELIEYEMGISIETCLPTSPTEPHPDSKKGAIIVGI